MDKPPYEIATDEALKLVRFTLHGFWDVPMVERFAHDSRAATYALAARGCSIADVAILVDRRDQPAQSQEVIAAMQQLSGQNSGLVRRSAVLVGGALTKLQTDRISQAGSTRLFTDEHDALAWLQTDDTAP